MKTIKDIILGRKDPGNLHAWAKTNEDHSIDLGIWYNGKWNFIGGSSEGGGGDAGGVISDEQIIHIVADATYHEGDTYIEPQVNESLSSDLPTHAELLNLINKYKGQVFIDYTVRAIDDEEEVHEDKFLLRYAVFRKDTSKNIIFMGPEGVYIVVFISGNVLCHPLRIYQGYFECDIENEVATFNYTYEAVNTALEVEGGVTKCVINDIANFTYYNTTLTKRALLGSGRAGTIQFIFSNSYVQLKVEYSNEDKSLISTTFQYFEEQTPD